MYNLISHVQLVSSIIPSEKCKLVLLFDKSSRKSLPYRSTEFIPGF